MEDAAHLNAPLPHLGQAQMGRRCAQSGSPQRQGCARADWPTAPACAHGPCKIAAPVAIANNHFKSSAGRNQASHMNMSPLNCEDSIVDSCAKHHEQGWVKMDRSRVSTSICRHLTCGELKGHCICLQSGHLCKQACERITRSFFA